MGVRCIYEEVEITKKIFDFDFSLEDYPAFCKRFHLDALVFASLQLIGRAFFTADHNRSSTISRSVCRLTCVQSRTHCQLQRNRIPHNFQSFSHRMFSKPPLESVTPFYPSSFLDHLQRKKNEKRETNYEPQAVQRGRNFCERERERELFSFFEKETRVQLWFTYRPESRPFIGIIKSFGEGAFDSIVTRAVACLAACNLLVRTPIRKPIGESRREWGMRE